MSTLGNPLKICLREKMKKEVLKRISEDSRKRQSDAIFERVIASECFAKAQRVSIYLSTSTEVDTTKLLREMFNQSKQIFVPTYNKNVMEMVKLENMEDYESLPLTKWGIKQPKISDGRENALETGGIDLFIVPGVAFTREGGRMGHGMGFYDKYFKRHLDTYPTRRSGRTVLMGVAFIEQILPENELPLDEHDVILNYVVTNSGIFASE